MVRGRPKKEYLSPTEIQGLKEEQREIQDTIRQVEDGVGVGARSADVTALKRQSENIDRIVAEGSAPEVRGANKDRLWKEEKELEEKIAEGMPSRDEMRYPHRNPGAVRKHLAWSARNERSIERYREIQRTLRPMEPKSIEVLRREK